MSGLALATCYLLGLAGTEGLGWATHRWLLHGPLWPLHRSHHRPRHGRFECNDLCCLALLLPVTLLVAGGAWLDWGHETLAGAAGMATYGALYGVMHHLLIHQRLRAMETPRSGWLARIARAHRLHHVVETRDGAVSFGFFLPRSPDRLRRQLAATAVATLRAPASARSPGL